MSNTEITAPSDIPQVIVTGEFDAPVDLVFRAHIHPDLLVRWLGPSELTLTVERFEAHHGGRWRYIQKDARGNEHRFHGVFHGDPSPSGIVQTFEYEGAPGHVKLDTTTFEERDGRTLLRTVSSFQSFGDRDAMVASGMEHGVRDSGDRLDALLKQKALR
jgi:uncharacterized protein YndB with AHSA1/START domain